MGKSICDQNKRQTVNSNPYIGLFDESCSTLVPIGLASGSFLYRFLDLPGCLTGVWSFPVMSRTPFGVAAIRPGVVQWAWE
jgi:hypothetical protein